MDLNEFRKLYPVQTVSLSSGKEFTYRYYKNVQAKATVVLLTGGIGLSDLLYRHFDRFAGDFSVLTFDYQVQFEDNGEFAEAVSELLRRLGEKAWLVGQSLGGIVAQIIASRHPESVDGLVLSNTCSLSQSMSRDAYDYLLHMIESQKRFRKLLPVLPFALFKRLMRQAVMKKVEVLTPSERAVMGELCDAMVQLLAKPYERHMIDFLVDAQNYFGMTREDFARWDDRVLLILSEDDATFSPDCKASLVDIMPNPTVVTDLEGGHLALLVRLERYADLVTGYIRQRM